MKKKKWLIVIVTILFVINIGFYVTVRLAKVDEIVKKKLSQYLSETLSSQVEIGEFSFNDRQINVSRLKIINPNFKIEVPQIYIEYRLLPLLFSNFKNLRSIRKIQIFDPEISYIFQDPKKKKRAGKFEIPDITDYFGSLEIHHGKFLFDYRKQVIFNGNETSLSVVNSRKTKIKFATKMKNSGKIAANITLKKGAIEKAHLVLENFFPDTLNTDFVDSFQAVLDLKLDYEKKKLNYTGNLKNLEVRKQEKIISAAQIPISGNKSEVNLDFSEFFIDGNNIRGNFTIKDLFSADRQIDGEFSAAQIPLSKYTSFGKGYFSADISAVGSLKNPKIRAKVSSRKISVFGQHLKNIVLLVNLNEKKISLKLKKAFWNGNPLNGNGYYRLGKNLSFHLNSDKLEWKKDNLEISAKLNSDFLLVNKIPNLNLNLSDISLKSNDVVLENYRLDAKLKSADLTISLENPKKDLSLFAVGNIKSKNLKANIKFRRFDLKQIHTSLPMISGNVSLEANPEKIVEKSTLRIFDKNLIKFDGLFESGLVLNLKKNRSELFLVSENAKFNYEPFSIKLKATGTLDSLKTVVFSLNDKINFDLWVKRKPSFDFGAQLRAENLKINGYMKYFSDYYTADNFRGLLSANISYNSKNKRKISGKIKAEKFKFNGISELNSLIEFSGNDKEITFDKICFANKVRKFADFEGVVKLKPELRIVASGKIDSLKLESIFADKELSGILNSELDFRFKENSENIGLNTNLQNFRYGNFKADSLIIKARQKKNLLQIEVLKAIRKNVFRLTGNGAIGFNFLRGENFADTNSVCLNFSGDLLKIISQQTDYLESGKSQTDCKLKIGINQNGLLVRNCDFSLSKASLKLKEQPEKIDKISVAFSITNNDFNIDKFKLRMGDGKLYIRNKIFRDERDLKIAMLNFGRIYLHTNEKGLLIYVPKYSPKNSVAKGIITGRDTDELVITGPLDDVHILGNIQVSNANIIYPPNIDNILKLFSMKNISGEKKEHGEFPVNLDLILDVKENVHYVTHPVDLLINPDGYLHLEKQNGKLIVSEAMFTSDEGSLEMFGARFKEDFMQILINHNRKEANISGVFYKKTGDGSLITLSIFNSKDKNSQGVLQFRLESDDPNDDMLDILSKLKYNRSLDDISVSQKKSMLQDEIIQQAGLEIGNAIIEPFIYPLENKLRRWLLLDYLQIQTDIFQNLFIRYYLNKSEEELPEEQPEYSEFDIFLENLTVKLGKYITQNLLCDYEVQFQRPKDLAISSEIGIYQRFTLRYDLPYKFKLALRFNLMPFKEKNSYEIMLERSFKFW